eukprot:TRINITY_DN937_c0_g1_i1.p1 TRINITY_DN937_c0_g1~~TRINITY_DN937_c0_g1_i1.p1  ORF type:complete len:431 (+),score=61.55 TRINITY_DN937_c0_g1_i1:50-1342(+)
MDRIHRLLILAILQGICCSADDPLVTLPSNWPDGTKLRDISFGHGMLELFQMGNFTNLNFGSFGSSPRDVIAVSRNWEDQMELNTDLWFRYNLRPIYDAVVKQVAEYVNANATDVALIENASTAVNSVLRSLKFESGEKILYMNTAYDMVKFTLDYISKVENLQLLEVNLTFPLSSQDIIQQAKQAIVSNKGSPIRLACFSHITSLPGTILPIKELIELCHANDVLVLIDGAHAIGQIPVNLTDLQPDFYLSNGHKWLFSPKGSAFLYVSQDVQSMIHPTVISNQYGNGFSNEFFYMGTRSYSAMLAMSAAIQWRAAIGEQKIVDYIHNLAIWGGNTLASMWKTDVLLDDSQIGAMTSVRMPTDDVDEAAALQQKILKEYSSFFVVYPLGSHIYTRISAQIFLEESDFVWIGNLVLEILSEMRNSQAFMS